MEVHRFYGHPEAPKRDEGWRILEYLKSCAPGPWLSVGDYNEIMDLTEKWGNAGRREGQMEKFHDTLEECQLSDLGFIGPKFTWSNTKEDGGFTKERLDCAIANHEWYGMFQEVDVHILAARSSNHVPIMVSFDRFSDERRTPKYGFNFEAKWLEDEEYHQLLREARQNGGMRGTRVEGVANKLIYCRGLLSNWSRRKYGVVERELRNKTA